MAAYVAAAAAQANARRAQEGEELDNSPSQSRTAHQESFAYSNDAFEPHGRTGSAPEVSHWQQLQQVLGELNPAVLPPDPAALLQHVFREHLMGWGVRPVQEVYVTLSHPEHSRLAFGLSMFVLAVILLNTGTFCVESVPRWENTPLYDRLVIVDYVCLGVFTLEFVLRLATCNSLTRFSMGLMNWVDLLAIAPFYVELIVVGPHGQAAAQTRIIRVLRLLRILRLLRATTRFRNLQVVVDSLMASGDVIGMLLLLLVVLLVVSSTIIYYVETALTADTWADSIPLTMWYMHAGRLLPEGSAARACAAAAVGEAVASAAAAAPAGRHLWSDLLPSGLGSRST
ncbi:Potassium voltage-gated channel subfamily A member 3 [Tetrabaena socialis]|uniref:Potassium voltage-gated channel subfamily A member 3 n=1 Tax=Tetrabaena socialis TaxID=47790 RepID=A0A2J7ZXN7_9CHLO|nr:Potassium voltage-gated channel subfamily A member 3 [Tetrabaena socialis]|eukprot:PNH05030.1 Potassium voltage-gated channel subfamily A member 3 [Tetrabaena socialis]